MFFDISFFLFCYKSNCDYSAVYVVLKLLKMKMKLLKNFVQLFNVSCNITYNGRKRSSYFLAAGQIKRHLKTLRKQGGREREKKLREKE